MSIIHKKPVILITDKIAGKKRRGRTGHGGRYGERRVNERQRGKEQERDTVG